jgi:hypothetical protein
MTIASPLKRYRVQLVETVTYDVDVEAENANDAGNIASDMWALSEDPMAEFDGQGQGIEVEYVDKQEG